MWVQRTVLVALLVALTHGVSVQHPAAHPARASGAEADHSVVVPPSAGQDQAGNDEASQTSEEETASSNDTAVDSNRTAKLFPPVIKIVTFNNDPCVSSTGLWGTCYTEQECASQGGYSSGTCANGYGRCCTFSASCGAIITKNNTYWSNTGYPTPYKASGICSASISPPVGTCQIMLTFEAFNLLAPVAGDCNNDTFVFVGGNSGDAIPVLCGQNGGQHYYVDVQNTVGPYKVITTTSAIPFNRLWNIKVTFVQEQDPIKAPFRCLQYFRSTSGSLASFNYGGIQSQMLNNLNYAVCFACVPGFCDVGISFNHFDLGNVNGICAYDYVAAGPNKYCGDFPSLVIQVNATGPLVLYVGSDSNNDNFESGFAGSYMMMAC